MISSVAPRAVTALLLLSSLVLGLAHIALLPPFEGFDEIGHYAYVQQVAETGRWPRLGDKMSKEIDDYLKIAPTSDAIAPPWSYFRFFSAPADVIAKAREALHSPPAQPRSFELGQIANWQGQHPPLYYYVLAPIYLASKHLSLVGHLFVLRAFSYLLAWTALCIVAVAAWRGKIPQRGATPMLLAVSTWPFIFPMWFPEMARIGNDSLVATWAALIAILAWSVTVSGRVRDHVLLGLVLGLALLTKAIFLPVAAAILILLGLQQLLTKVPGERRRRVKGLCIAVAILLAVCGWWYLQNLIETGNAVGSIDVRQMHAAGGLLVGLKKNLRIEDVLIWPWAFMASFLWAGTWSFVVPPRIFMLPLVALSAAIAFGAWRTLRRTGVQPVDWFALLFIVLFVAALTYHTFIQLSIAIGHAPAWYLHSLAPIVALFVGYGIVTMMSLPWVRGVMAALLLYPLVFLPGVLMLSALYFAGCAPKLPGRQYFARASGLECLVDFPRMYDNLGVIALPGTGIALFVAGWSIAVVTMPMMVRWLRANAVQTSITSTR